MKKNARGVLGLAALLGTLFVFGGTKETSAGVQVNINLGPPPIRVAEPQEVVVIPNSGVYFVPQADVDVFFYNGYWWSPRGSRWYRSRDYNGPWGVVSRRYVPAPVYRVPKNYRTAYGNQQHIPYGQWKKQGKDNRKGDKQGRGQDNGNKHDQGRR